MQGFSTSSKTTGTLTILQKHLCKLSHDQKKNLYNSFSLKFAWKKLPALSFQQAGTKCNDEGKKKPIWRAPRSPGVHLPQRQWGPCHIKFSKTASVSNNTEFKKMGMHQRKASRQKLYIAFNPQRPEQALTARQVLDLVSRILKWLPENLNWVLSRVRAGPLLPITQQSQIAFWYARGDTSLRHPRKAWQRKLRVHTMHRHTHHRLVGVTPACMDYPSDNIEHSKVCWENIRQLLSVRRPHTRA